MRPTLVLAALVGCTLATVGGLSTGASAATCAGFSVTTTPASSCFADGNGPNDVNGSAGQDVIIPLGYLVLDKNDDTTTGLLNGALTITNGVSSGSFSISAPGYTDLILALKTGGNDKGQGNGTHDPVWAAFLLGALSGTWAIFDPIKNLSHAVLYGHACPPSGCGNNQDPPPPAVPLPGAVWLMGTLLAGSAGISRWRKRRARKAA